MADPFSMGAAALGGQAAGGILGAVGSLFGGSSSASNYQFQAGQALLNSKIAKQNEEYSFQSGESQALNSGLASRFRIGQITAAQGANGFKVGVGTNADVVGSQREIGQMEQGAIRTNAYKTALGYDYQAKEDQTQAMMDMQGASNAQTSGILGAVGSVLGGVSGVSSKWLGGQQSGLWGGSGGSSSGNILYGGGGSGWGLGF